MPLELVYVSFDTLLDEIIIEFIASYSILKGILTANYSLQHIIYPDVFHTAVARPDY